MILLTTATPVDKTKLSERLLECGEEDLAFSFSEFVSCSDFDMSVKIFSFLFFVFCSDTRCKYKFGVNYLCLNRTRSQRGLYFTQEIRGGVSTTYKLVIMDS